MEEQHVQSTATRTTMAFHVDWFTVAFWGIVLGAAILRFYDLASKPLHHDESLYGVYCWRFFKGEGYRYDPMMHGPFMFHLQVLIFFLFGVGDFSVRMAPALLGTLMIAGTCWLKDFIGLQGTIATALFLTFSPTHLYFSRFMRHDAYSACFTLFVVVFALLYARKRHPTFLYLTLASLALMFCVKENAYIHAFIFMTFVLLQDLVRMFLLERTAAHEQVRWFVLAGSLGIIGIPVLILVYFVKNPVPEILLTIAPASKWAVFLLVLIHVLAALWVFFYWLYQRDLRPLSGAARYRITLILGTCVFLWIYIVLYSTVFTHSSGVIDGLAKSWTYWWNQHSIQRIKGPFHYYVPFMWQYELPVFLIAIIGVLCSIANTLNKRIVVVWAAVFPFIVLIFFGEKPLPSWLAFTHMEVWTDLILTLWVLGLGGWATLHFWVHRQWLAAFLTYWSGLGFLVYSYAGEKVPWLFLHILLPVTLLAGLLVQRFLTWPIWRQRRSAAPWLGWITVLVIALFSAYSVHFTVLLNYYNPANPVETMVYTQTSTDILDLLDLAEDVKFTLGSEEAKKPIIAVQGNAVWPLAWYLRDYEGWYVPGDLSAIQRPLIVIDWEERSKYQEVFGDAYQEIRVKLREWWIPKSRASFKEWWQYLAYRRVFSPTGSSDVALYVRRQ